MINACGCSSSSLVPIGSTIALRHCSSHPRGTNPTRRAVASWTKTGLPVLTASWIGQGSVWSSAKMSGSVEDELPDEDEVASGVAAVLARNRIVNGIDG